MPKAQDAANWTNPPLFKRPAGVEGPLVSTLAGRRDGSRPVDEPEPDPEPTPQGEILRESFDGLTDWTSTMHSTDTLQMASNGYVIPENWEGAYQSTMWSPETGHPDKHASMEILASNIEKTRSGSGKSAVVWRESVEGSGSQWKSDSQLVRTFPSTPTVYAEVWIAFDNDWWQRNNFDGWVSKMFRVGHWDGAGSLFSGFQGAIGPLFLWDYARNNFGLRNVYSFRGGPPGDNYRDLGSAWGDGDHSWNFTDHTQGMAPGGADPQVPDLVNGGFILDNPSQLVSHDQVYGADSTVWTKMAFYVEMNSAPGVEDGIIRQWINGVRIRNTENVMWVGPNTENEMVGWNFVSIGGNHRFEPFPDSERYEDWYAYDDLLVLTSPPEGLV